MSGKTTIAVLVATLWASACKGTPNEGGTAVVGSPPKGSAAATTTGSATGLAAAKPTGSAAATGSATTAAAGSGAAAGAGSGVAAPGKDGGSMPFPPGKLPAMVDGSLLAYSKATRRVAAFVEEIADEEQVGLKIFDTSEGGPGPAFVPLGEDKYDPAKEPAFLGALIGFADLPCPPLAKGKLVLASGDTIKFAGSSHTLTVTRDGKATSRVIDNGGVMDVVVRCAVELPDGGPLVVRVDLVGDVVRSSSFELF